METPEQIKNLINELEGLLVVLAKNYDEATVEAVKKAIAILNEAIKKQPAPPPNPPDITLGTIGGAIDKFRDENSNQHKKTNKP